ncbi:MAG: hypothetical protein WA432_01135 [Candidatus Babeliaceae bacterium]
MQRTFNQYILLIVSLLALLPTSLHAQETQVKKPSLKKVVWKLAGRSIQAVSGAALSVITVGFCGLAVNDWSQSKTRGDSLRGHPLTHLAIYGALTWLLARYLLVPGAKGTYQAANQIRKEIIR